MVRVPKGQRKRLFGGLVLVVQQSIGNLEASEQKETI